MIKRTPFLPFVFLFLLLASSPLMAQSNYAVLGGTVSDPQQRVIAGADVQLTSVSTRAERHVTANDQGIFQITGLLPGDYQLTIKVTGFATFSRTLRLEVGQQVNLDASLKIASVVGTVDVSAPTVEVLRPRILASQEEAARVVPGSAPSSGSPGEVVASPGPEAEPV